MLIINFTGKDFTMDPSKIKAFREAEQSYFQSQGLSIDEDFIQLKDSSQKVRVQRTGSGDPLLFIHGSMNAGTTWAELVAQFPDRTCMIVDRPGCGLSDTVSFENFTSTDQDELIYNTIGSVLEHYQINKTEIIGSSFGGFWTVKFANRFPEKVSKIVLEGCPAMVEGMNVPKFMQTIIHPLMSRIIPLLPVTKSSTKKIMKDMGHVQSVKNDVFRDDLYEWYGALMNKTKTMKNEIASLKVLLHKDKMNTSFIMDDDCFARLKCPVLMLWGEEDTFGGSKIAHRLQSKLQHGELRLYPNEGHLPWLDHIETHASEIQAFLEAPGKTHAGNEGNREF